MKAQDLVLSNTRMHHLLGDSAFYASLPAGFDDLAEVGKKAYFDGLQMIVGNTDSLPKSKECGGCTDLGLILRPFVDEFGRRIHAIAPQNRSCFEPLRSLISQYFRAPIRKLVLYYKDEKNVTTFVQF